MAKDPIVPGELTDPVVHALAERWRSRIVGTGEADPGELLANPDNWRIHPREQRAALAGVLDRVGWVQHVVVNRTTGHVVDGHLRVDLAMEREEAAIPVLYVELTADEERLVLAALDPLAAMAVADQEKLEGLLGAIQDPDAGQVLDVILEPQLGTTVPAREKPSRDTEFELPDAPVTRAGDRIRLGDHVLYCGDTFSADAVGSLMGSEVAAMLATDPPYAIYGSSTGVSSDTADDKMVRPFFTAMFRAALEVVAPFGHLYVCCDWRSWSAIWEAGKQAGAAPRNLLVWDKGSAGLGANYFNTYELIGFFARLPKQNAMRTDQPAGVRPVHRPNILRFERVPGGQREHNAQKPVALLEELITNSSDPRDVVLDLFGGSGSTLIAADGLDRRAYVMEIEPAWCDVIVQRWETETGRRARRPRRRGPA